MDPKYFSALRTDPKGPRGTAHGCTDLKKKPGSNLSLQPPSYLAVHPTSDNGMNTTPFIPGRARGAEEHRVERGPDEAVADPLGRLSFGYARNVVYEDQAGKTCDGIEHSEPMVF